MISSIIKQYDFNLAYAKRLVVDLDEIQMTTSPGIGFENHPAFTLGHLATGSAMTAEDLGGTFEIPAGWDELFIRKGPGDPRLPSSIKESYPSKEILLSELEIQHNKVKNILNSMDDEKLSTPIKWRFNTYMPTILDLAVFMCINHESMHLGQLAAWRRAMRLPSALAQL